MDTLELLTTSPPDVPAESFYYRFGEAQYEEYANYPEILETPSGEALLCERFRVIRKTPAGVFIKVNYREKFILDNARKRWAYPTRALALESFIERKRKHQVFQDRRSQSIRSALAAAESLMLNVPTAQLEKILAEGGMPAVAVDDWELPAEAYEGTLTLEDATFHLLDRYTHLLKKLGAVAQADKDGTTTNHLMWMCQTARREWPADKLSRWLGYIQGVLAARGLVDVAAERSTACKLVFAVYRADKSTYKPLGYEFGR